GPAVHRSAPGADRGGRRGARRPPGALARGRRGGRLSLPRQPGGRARPRPGGGVPRDRPEIEPRIHSIRARAAGRRGASRGSRAAAHPERSHPAHGGAGVRGGVQVRARLRRRVRSPGLSARRAAGTERVRADRVRIRARRQEADGMVGATQEGGGRAVGRSGGPVRLELTTLLALTACATLGKLSFHEPELQLQEINVTGVGLTGGTFELVFDVYNPNEYRIRSTRLEVGVDLEGTHFGDALLERPLDLSPTNHRSEEHTSELQSRENLVCRLLLEKKKQRQRR